MFIPGKQGQSKKNSFLNQLKLSALEISFKPLLLTNAFIDSEQNHLQSPEDSMQKVWWAGHFNLYNQAAGVILLLIPAGSFF